MDNKNPQDKTYVFSKWCALLQDSIGVFVLLLSIFQSLALFVKPKIFLIISSMFLLVEYVIEYQQSHKFDEGHYTREIALLDNSFNEKRIPNYNGDEYYNNESVSVGHIKLLANIHESSLYTSKVTEKMLLKYYIIISLVLIIFIVQLMLNGINDILHSILVFIVSFSFIKRALNIRSLNKVAKDVFSGANDICYKYEKNKNDASSLLSDILMLVLKYENSLFATKVALNSKIFNKINDETMKEWRKIKSSYIIYNLEDKE